MGAGSGQRRRTQSQAQTNGAVKLWLDDLRTPPDGSWTWVKTAAEARELLLTGNVTIASLDHDLGQENENERGETGYRLLLWMAENEIWPADAVLVHSANAVGIQNMRGVIKRYGPYGN